MNVFVDGHCSICCKGLFVDIDHKSDRLKVSDGYPADDIYDDVEPDNEQKPSPVKYSLGGVTTTSSS